MSAETVTGTKHTGLRGNPDFWPIFKFKLAGEKT